MLEKETETSQVPSEETTQGQGDESCQQEVSDSVEVKWGEDCHGDGQREREAGGHTQEFTEKHQGKKRDDFCLD